MTSSRAALAVELVRAWSRLYTIGLPPAARDARRAEIDSDLWELQHDRAADRLPPAAHIMARWLLGIPDDLAWRAAQHRPRPRARRVTLALAALSIAAVLAAAVWVLPLLRPPALPVPPHMMRFAAQPPPVPPAHLP